MDRTLDFKFQTQKKGWTGPTLHLDFKFQTQKKGWTGPVLGVKVASENRRNFDDDVLKEIIKF